MKKVLTLLMLLCIVCTGAWAQDFTVATTTTDYNAIQVGHYYAFRYWNGDLYLNGADNKTATVSTNQIYKIVDAGEGKVWLQCYGTSKYIGLGNPKSNGNQYETAMVEETANAIAFTLNKRNNNAQVVLDCYPNGDNTKFWLAVQNAWANPAHYQNNGTGELSYWYAYEVTIPSLQIDVTVSYKHGDNVLDTDTPKYYAGTYTFLPREIPGYKCRVESKEVTIDAENHTVEFQYDKYFDVTVEGKYGETVLWSETQSRLDVINTFNARFVPGYTCSEATQNVSITGAGQTVTFNYTKAEAIRITNYTSAAPTRLTVEQFKSLKGTGAHFAMHSTQQESWSTFAASDTHQSDVSVDYMFTLAEGSQPNTYWIKNFAGETMTAAGGGNVPTFEQDGTGFDWSIIQSPTSASKFDADKQVRFCNGEGQNYAAHYKQFGDYAGDWGRYVTYGPFYAVTVNAKYNGETIATKTLIYSAGIATISAPQIAHYYSTDADMTGVEIFEDKDIDFNYLPIVEPQEGHVYRIKNILKQSNGADDRTNVLFNDIDTNNRISSQILTNDAAVNDGSYYAPKYYFVAQEVTEDHVTFASALGTAYAGTLNNSNTNTVAKMQAAQEKVQFEYTDGPIAGTIAFKVGDNYIAGCRGYADRFIYRTENAAYLEGPQGVKYSTAFQLEDVTDRFEGYAANMTTELSNGIYGTLNLPYNSVVPEGVEAYIFTAKTEEGEISFAREYGAGDILPANEPVLLCTETVGSYKFLPTEDSASASEDNLFSGTLCQKDQNKGEAEYNSDIYVLGKNAANCFTFMHTSSATINSNKAYIDLSTMEPEVQSLVRGFSFELNGGTITAISGAHAHNIYNESATYDLQGRRLQSLVKGVNIVSGRKVLK